MSSADAGRCAELAVPRKKASLARKLLRRAQKVSAAAKEGTSVAEYLRGFGYSTADGQLQGGGPTLSLSVTEHEEIRGHTVYKLQCLLMVDGVVPVRWQVGRRLCHLRELWHDHIKVELGDDYGQLFKGCHFATRGGGRGTSKSLNSWCQRFATCANTGQLPPVSVALTLRFLEAPETSPKRRRDKGATEDLVTSAAAALQTAPIADCVGEGPEGGSGAQNAEKPFARLALDSVSLPSGDCRCSTTGSRGDFISDESPQCMTPSSNCRCSTAVSSGSDRHSDRDSDCSSICSDASDDICDRMKDMIAQIELDLQDVDLQGAERDRLSDTLAKMRDWASDFVLDSESSDEDCESSDED